MSVNDTMVAFGYPDSLVHEDAHWAVLLRRPAVTAGALVLAYRGAATRLPDVPAEAWASWPRLTGAIERTLADCCDVRKVNYLALMMRDPHVHFHVIPRYDGPRVLGGVPFDDPGWPGGPALGHSTTLDETQFAAVRDALRVAWPSD